uniref:Cytochrome c oxidase subunit 3 n=1 Tax=Danio albolineatus TaxID=27699 RepID=A0A140E9Z4_9TELE|nr:cytochrome c oxidase subunit III [Danio albolineatus]AMK97357.1 cytochrome c oxidase subunit III [Danio albolineatus]
MAHQAHAYVMVHPSRCPVTRVVVAMLLTSGVALCFLLDSLTVTIVGMILLTLAMILCWPDIVPEGSFHVLHSPAVLKGLRYDMILFIASELFFFSGLLWEFYCSCFAPSRVLRCCRPRNGVTTLEPIEVALVITAVYFSSGVVVAWGHHSMMDGERKQAIQCLTLSILLGLYFTALLAMEYDEALFTIGDGTYGSTFFVATGFDGLHVIVGSSFQATCHLRQVMFQFACVHLFGFDAAVWYSHLLEVVWTFLYVPMDWCGS